MKKIAELAGAGVTTALAQGKKDHLQAMQGGKGLYRTRVLDLFEEPIEVPYLAVEQMQPGDNQDPMQHLQWLLDCSLEEALSECNLTDEIRKKIPIFIGSSSYGIGIGEKLYQTALDEAESAIPIPLDGFTQIGDHLRSQHGFLGSDYAYNTACTGSANALLSAVSSIEQGDSDYALVVGVEAFNATTLAGFYGMQLLAPEMMRPFDKNRSGLVLGEGCGVLLLKAARPEAASLIICGGASRCDTYSISASNPDGSAIAEVMQDALDQTGVCSSEIVAIKAHGTGSPLNDNGEAAGMKKVFTTVSPFFSFKSYIGHTLGGCGAIETALMATCIEQQKLPASGGFENEDKTLGVTPISQSQAVGRGYYMLNYFGFGGNNCSLIIYAS